MEDTAFFVPEDKLPRLAALYVPAPGTRELMRYDAMGKAITRRPVYLSGGGGLVSTARDYHRFIEMLRRGGELEGVRLLGTRTVRYMTRNHLPGGADLEAFGQSTFAETTFDGVGFGLGFAVVEDTAASKTLSSPGEFSWGGAASTGFFVDPHEDITAVFLTQLLPSSTYNLRPQLKQVLYQALVA
jgi:CubicO group peptidase (beta-lactamase class C family)